MKWLVFSKDRPYQLDAFIRTAQENGGINASSISVLHHYSENVKEDLRKLMQEHPDVRFIEQKDFQKDVLKWLKEAESETISFATDDAIFTRQIPSQMIEELLVKNPQVTTFSLRMGLHLDYCYPTNTSQKLPNGQLQGGIFAWSTEDAEGDWGYPLSVDGHVFLRQFAIDMLSSFNFSNPNTMESHWQIIKPHVSKLACCLPKSCYFNIPLNIVQDVYKNKCGNVEIEKLLKLYRRGNRIDSKRFLQFHNVSAHQETCIDGDLL